MDKPNIFKYATKELSQDAFICWLLSWADDKYKECELNHIAKALLKKFFDLENVDFPSIINSITIDKQYKNVDVLCRINDSYTIIIEDKTNTKAHGKQLIRYRDVIEECFPNDKILAIYFKTHDQSNYNKEIEEGFKVFDRIELIKILDIYPKFENDIFQDFRQYIHAIESEVNAYVSKKAWSSRNWIGFFKFLKNELKQGDWEYVPNQSGGFMGYWWAFQRNEYCTQYLQIQQDDLVLKITCNNAEYDKKFRAICYKHYIAKAKENGLNFEKPARFGKGQTMTILRTNYLIKNQDTGLVDLQDTLEKLKQYTTFIESNFLDVAHFRL